MNYSNIFVSVIIHLGKFLLIVQFYFIKQKTAYELRISDWSSDMCSSDLRELSQQIHANTGKNVMVDNRPGASGNIGAEHVARSAPDGKTLLVAATTFATNASVNTATLPYNPKKDFTPVALLGTGTLCLVVTSTFPANPLQEFIAEAKAKTGRLQ